ncbi:hypothetical protein DCAR_0623202 [Daucus carota subsp. sativus]|uniref:CBF1-interacting co-repressor CIR N-terminal domain-containing protein n=1 Tax=Daucus carota subsp. sativus TaxID=79200 RepID=A0AAF1B4L1_DAUCS|nr:hypothetical protein DCAR_0623202 [Daucus carota subsp. sativus]
MGLKFLNKKGWHTGSLRNIENVWKAEQKRDAEDKKLEELRKQIHEERERSEFRLLQEQAGLIPKQERLDFLYDSGLAVGKASESDGFKSLEALPSTQPDDKPQSANDAWRKLHSDPLLLIRQREQEALARVKNNPVKMAMIRESVEAKKHKKSSDRKEHGKKQKKSKHKKSSSSGHHSHSGDSAVEREEKVVYKKHERKYNECVNKGSSDSEYELSKDAHRERRSHREPKYKETSSSNYAGGTTERSYRQDKSAKYSPKGLKHSEYARREADVRNRNVSDNGSRHDSNSRNRRKPVKLSEEERAARLQEMQMNAELHEEQRWKRLKKAEEDDAREIVQGHDKRNFLDDVTKSVYGAEKGGSSSIGESVRRRAHYSQGRSQVGEGNAFRR